MTTSLTMSKIYFSSQCQWPCLKSTFHHNVNGHAQNLIFMTMSLAMSKIYYSSQCQWHSKIYFSSQCHWPCPNLHHNVTGHVQNPLINKWKHWQICRFKKTYENLFFVCFGFYVTSTQNRSYRDIPALLVEEDLRCPSMHYFRHKWAPE
jgi:hypothetical protein